MSFEGIPDGFEFVGIRPAKEAEHHLTWHGRLQVWGAEEESECSYAILRKIEKQKQYRPFASKAEFAPHRDRWVVLKTGVNDDEFSVWRIASYDFDAVLILGGRNGKDEVKFAELFENFVFDNLDGTFEPCGVEVTE